MKSKLLSIYNSLLALKRVINNMLIVFFVKNKMLNLLSLLLFFNSKKIKEIQPSNYIKYRVIVLPKSGGIDDLVSSQKKYNKDILYIKLPREFIYKIYSTIFNIKHPMDIKNLSKKEISALKIKYKNFLKKFIKIVKKKYEIDAFVGFNYEYVAEEDLHTVCSELNIPFLVLYKESVATELETKYRAHIIKKKKQKFNGYKIAIYSDYGKKILVQSNLVKKNKIEVVGCARLSRSFSIRKIKPKNQILYYVIESFRGLPNSFTKKVGRSFFNDLKVHKKFKSDYNWEKLHIKTVAILKKFALQYPDVSIIFKIKTGEKINKRLYLNLPQNIKINYFGAGHELLRDSKVIIGWNTTALLEGIAANRFILLPYFLEHFDFKNKDELLNLKLKSKNFGYSENDFYKKLILFMGKKYDKNQTYNNQHSLKYHLGNSDNKADLRLDKFIRNNITIDI